ncbi:hypothetical protein RHSIM_Rhsim05G0113500 [Rhododendron simsii]|uniref:PB1 domain-containing protein n=1 Tax=Rhododendron simsii TaxID=118357 RepID=A0A834H190_RHOSS|nr:hypothetical protein RHSIM_Rhsim05G0113500 [Rhododendron simsii]
MAAEEVIGGGGGGGESVPASPRNKVKLLCSHGGKILPRSADGHLKYVGGETRIVSFPRDINFSDLMKKLASVSDGDIILKYQIIPEDLDALVSVKTEEDLRHMLDEHDRYESAGNPMLRAFLFPANPVVTENRMMTSTEHQAIEQRYIDAVNGIIRSTTTVTTAINHHVTTGKPLSPTGVSSTSSSPKSPESCNIETVFQKSRQLHIHRVHSSPSISSLSGQNHHSTTTAPMPHNQQHNQNYQKLQRHGYLSPRAQTPERLVSVRSVGREDSWKYQVIPGPPVNYYPVAIARHTRGSGCYCSKCMHFDEYGAYKNRKIARAGSPFRSPPLPRSPS